MGNIACGLSSNRISSIETVAISDAIYEVQANCEGLSADERRIWVEVAMSKLQM